MITDRQTNFLYLADSLPKDYPEFFKSFESVLKECNIPFDWLPNTKDIWAVDYMPIQTRENEFIQFRYEPDYLMDSEENKATISDVDAICKAIGIKPIKSNINLDGGNVVQWNDKAILCNKIFKENGIGEDEDGDELVEELTEYFNIKEENLHFVPEDELDFTGHADGMVRFVGNNTVLVNDYSEEDPEFQIAFQEAIKETGLEQITLPYQPEEDPEETSAVGLYLNYLEMEQAVIAPIFDLPTDEKAVRILKNVFAGKTVKTLNCTELARKGGGILNCITWNILR